MLSAHPADVPRDHAVAFYDSDAELVATLVGFVSEGLALGEGVVVVATPEHRQALQHGLDQLGKAAAAEQLLLVDAAGLLAEISTPAGVDAERMTTAVRRLLDRAAASGRGVRVFGEMVALLWDDGDVLGALALEDLWNQLRGQRPFLLLCGYSTSALAPGAGLVAVDRVCRCHSSVEPPARYGRDLTVPSTGDVAETRTETFVPVPTAVRVVRRFVAGSLAAWNREERLPDVELVVSELATNAVRHAASPFRVCLSQVGGGIRIEVEDVGPGRPQVLPPSDERLSGRGVALVAALSDEWGVRTAPGGKVVWADFDAA